MRRFRFTNASGKGNPPGLNYKERTVFNEDVYICGRQTALLYGKPIGSEKKRDFQIIYRVPTAFHGPKFFVLSFVHDATFSPNQM